MENNEQLAKALEHVRSLSDEGIVKSSQISPKERNLLVKAAFLERVVRGWYMLVTPEGAGSTTAFYSMYWSFLRQYLADRFGQEGYCLSPQSSLDFITGETTIPEQVVVLTAKASNVTLELPRKTSVLMYQETGELAIEADEHHGINIMPLPLALAKAPAGYFQSKPRNIEIALSFLGSPAEISRELVRLALRSSAERIAGAYLKIGNSNACDTIIQDMATAGYKIRPTNPFEEYKPLIGQRRMESPYSARILSLWEMMKGQVQKEFSGARELQSHEPMKTALEEILARADEDAYHSLSIEGYRVSDELIARVRNGEWAPDINEDDRSRRDALAAKGYRGAFELVLSDIKKVLEGEDRGPLLRRQLHQWYRELFLPLLQAGILEVTDLVGYRRNQVYIQNARHVPPPFTAMTDAMDMLFTLIEAEEDPIVRAVLGHYFFVYIHPYMDGNGRVARFLMNFLLASSHYPWTIIRVSERSRYMSALDFVATDTDIRPFAKFILSEMEYWQVLRSR